MGKIIFIHSVSQLICHTLWGDIGGNFEKKYQDNIGLISSHCTATDILRCAGLLVCILTDGNTGDSFG
jgi:hypothetical protein